MMDEKEARWQRGILSAQKAYLGLQTPNPPAQLRAELVAGLREATAITWEYATSRAVLHWIRKGGSMPDLLCNALEMCSDIVDGLN